MNVLQTMNLWYIHSEMLFSKLMTRNFKISGRCYSVLVNFAKGQLAGPLISTNPAEKFKTSPVLQLIS